MDPITHSLTGYVISNVLYNKYHVEKNTSFHVFSIAVVMGAVSPDIDFVTRYIGGDTLYFMNHRTITHSPVGLLVLSLLCALIVKMVKRNQKYVILFTGALIGALSHTLLDITNVYSTLALWPFSNEMYSLNLMSIIDLFILGLYIISISLSCLKPFKPYRRKIFISVAIIIFCYIGLKAYIQHDLKSYLLSEYKKGSFTVDVNKSEVDKISVMAGFIGVNSWNFIIENNDEFIKGNVLFNNHTYSGITSIKKKEKDIAIQRALETPLGSFVLKFSPFIDYTEDKYKDGYLVRMIDLRYAFNLNVGGGQDLRNSHGFGGYIVLDSQYTPVFWSTKYP